jgi:hypothetical protein
VTTEIQGACGIAAGYPKEIDIEHNEVAEMNYSGISVGYGWTTATNAMSNNIIQYNNVHNVANILADGAAIYVMSNQGPASQMEYNYLHDFSQSKWADYQMAVDDCFAQSPLRSLSKSHCARSSRKARAGTGRADKRGHAHSCHPALGRDDGLLRVRIR